METQEEVWDKIAPEWHEFKTNPSREVMEFLGKQEGNILDLGSGSGRHLTKIKNGKMYLLDFSSEMIKFAEEKAKKEKIPIETQITDMKKIPYKDEFFDSAISMSSLHSAPKKDHIKILKELHRVLKPKTKSLISVWDKDSIRFNKLKGNEKNIKWRDKGTREYYIYNEKDLRNILEKTGFKILERIPHSANITLIIEK